MLLSPRFFALLICLFLENEASSAPQKKLISKVQLYQASEFDLSSTRLPMGFLGLDLMRAGKVLSRYENYRSKDKFESDLAFKERIAQAPKSFKLYGSINDTSIVALAAPIPVSDIDFDANEELLIWKPGVQGKPESVVYSTTIDLGISIKQKDEYLGQNSYGARAQVNQVSVSQNEVTIIIPASSENIVKGERPYDNSLRIAFRVSPNTAKDIFDLFGKENFRFLMIGKLRSPYIMGQASSLGDATLESPLTGYVFAKNFLLDVQEVWLYRVSTGEIIAKQHI